VNATTVTHTILAKDGTETVQAQPATPGLYVYLQPASVDVGASCRWRLGHHSGLQIARFRTPEEAHAAAAAIADLTDWTQDADDIRERALGVLSDASKILRLDLLRSVEEAGGHIGNCAHPDAEGWLPNGGHNSDCAYVGGISSRCTCG